MSAQNDDRAEIKKLVRTLRVTVLHLETLHEEFTTVLRSAKSRLAEFSEYDDNDDDNNV